MQHPLRAAYVDVLRLTSSRGALKSNIGHLEGGSGVAGVIKAIMVLEKGIIPPNAIFETVNLRIDADFLNLKVWNTLRCPESNQTTNMTD